MSVFVTVGTTFFEDLVENVTSKNVIQMMQEFGYSSLIIQYGRGKFPVLPDSNNFPCETFDYKSSITKYISDAALVISHAGAGSCLEVLAAGKPLIVVINEKLMDNHQHELAEQLNKDGHLLYCTPRYLL
ncbi:UDP-N-acetylglucosamine transferase subunit ALG13-like isoform X2 [Styela clava]|uniref:UDP-N-acetylglucosamine transferase subunit ALG13 homolog isoform X2 n=1 Tax=Styela clava TaxID=7725 RepID=UPI00193941E0|nr:UDP-N-acetylglucosamine transferase subunit ALG13 homolog isoform X2 [Styela clava]